MNRLLVPRKYNKTPQLLIIGSGGHAGVVSEAVSPPEMIFGFIDEHEELGTQKHGRAVVTEPTELGGFVVHVAIGDNRARGNMCYQERFKDKLVTIIHPFGVAMRSQIGKGSFVAAGAVIGNNCEIGEGVIINTNSSVDHDCAVGDYSHIAPGVTIGGHVIIGKLAMIGLGACIRDRVTIGDRSIIGMGSVVTKDIPHGVVAYGNPARVIRKCE